MSVELRRLWLVANLTVRSSSPWRRGSRPRQPSAFSSFSRKEPYRKQRAKSLSVPNSL